MRFDIKDGLDKIAIGSFAIGEYIRIEKPTSIVWADCMGSVGEYLYMLPCNKTYREEIGNAIQECVNNDYTGKVESLYETLAPIFKLFKSGTYSLGFTNNKNDEFFQYKSSRDNYTNTHYYDWAVLFQKKEIVKPTGLKRLFTSIGEVSEDGFDPPNTVSFYSLGARFFIATKFNNEIDKSRVAFFEKKIKNGERPFAIIMGGDLEVEYTDVFRNNFILDGHHKLLAYFNLKISPPLAIITYLPKSLNEVECDMKFLVDNMLPQQVDHIFDNINWYDEFLDELINNPQSSLKDFTDRIKRG